jgi:hypothetical protein
MENGGNPGDRVTTQCCRRALTSTTGGGEEHALAGLFVLRELMVSLNSERQKRGYPLVKPWELFDLVGGTGMGG